MRAFAVGPPDIVDTDLPWDMTNPARAEVLLSRMKEELASDPLQRARAVEAATQLARAQSMQGKLVEAERTLDEAEKMLSSVDELGPRLRTLLERGRLLVLKKTPMEARRRFLEALELAMESDELFYAIDAAQMMSVVETKKMKSEWTVRALELAEGSSDPRVRSWCGPLHADLGWHFAELLQHERALASFEKAAECFDSEGADRRAAMARCAMARTLRLMDRVEEALALQRAVEKELEKIRVSDGVVFEELGECLRTLGRAEEAETYFRRAYDLLVNDEWLKNNEPARIKRLKTLANVK